MTIKATVEAGVGGPHVMTSSEEGVERDFPHPRVSRMTIEDRPPHVSDLRITLWITLEIEIGEDEFDHSTAITREVLDRVVDAIAVSAGNEVRIYHWSERFSTPRGKTIRLRPVGIAESSSRPFDVIPLMSAPLTGKHYRALRHLRHGLAHTSPERRFSSLMLTVMILAQMFPPPPDTERKCPSCHAKLPQKAGDRQRLLNLTNILGGWTIGEIDALWKLRNTVMGHGARDLTPEAAMELLDAGFAAARLAYDCLNASLPGLNLPGPEPSWFVTDLYLLLDSGDHAHETCIDVRLRSEGDRWVAAWPAVAPEEFQGADPATALRAARDHAVRSMKRPPGTADRSPPDVVRLTIHV